MPNAHDYVLYIFHETRESVLDNAILNTVLDNNKKITFVSILFTEE